MIATPDEDEDEVDATRAVSQEWTPLSFLVPPSEPKPTTIAANERNGLARLQATGTLKELANASFAGTQAILGLEKESGKEVEDKCIDVVLDHIQNWESMGPKVRQYKNKSSPNICVEFETVLIPFNRRTILTIARAFCLKGRF
jgi:hypothetical protein